MIAAVIPAHNHAGECANRLHAAPIYLNGCPSDRAAVSAFAGTIIPARIGIS